MTTRVLSFNRFAFVDKVVPDWLFTFGFAYVFLVFTWLIAVIATWPTFDNTHLYDSYPQMSPQEAKASLDRIDSLASKGPVESVIEAKILLEKVNRALTRVEQEPGFRRERFFLYQESIFRAQNWTISLWKEYSRRFTLRVVMDTRDHYEKKHPELFLSSDMVRREIMRQFWEAVNNCLFWYFCFLCPLTIRVRFWQKGLSLCRECLRPWRLLFAYFLLPVALWNKYPQESWYEQSKNTLKTLAWFVCAVMSCGTAAPLAKAQFQKDSKKKTQGVGMMFDYRRTDAVAGDGPGGLPNTLYVQAERVPGLPKKMVFQSLNFFGEAGFQSNVLAGATNAVSKGGLSLTPVAGYQRSNGGTNGVVFGTQGFFKKGRLSMVLPSLWVEKTLGSKASAVAWAMARPFVKVHGPLSVGVELGHQVKFGKKDFSLAGPAVEWKTDHARVSFFGLWRSNDSWVFRTRIVFVH